MILKVRLKTLLLKIMHLKENSDALELAITMNTMNSNFGLQEIPLLIRRKSPDDYNFFFIIFEYNFIS